MVMRVAGYFIDMEVVYVVIRRRRWNSGGDLVDGLGEGGLL